MIPIVSFIGWQDSGKTTVAQQVVTILKEKGFKVAVVKSTHHTSINFDREGSDTHTYCKTNPDSVTLMAPDQMVIMTSRPEMKLRDYVLRNVRDVDIVIGEGFKNERHIAKIEVTGEGGELLKDQVNGVVALVTEHNIPDATVFTPDQVGELADFIIEGYIQDPNRPDIEAVLFVNGKKVPMKGFVQDALAGTALGFVSSLKKTDNPESLEIRIRVNPKK